MFVSCFIRVDQKRIPYDLIWEDKVILSGKVLSSFTVFRSCVRFRMTSFTYWVYFFSFQSFYLPGSVDTHNKQLDDWNFKPPPLYLWSRRDWTARHKEIAKERGHILQELSAEGNNARNYLMEENYDGNQDYFSLHESDDLSTTPTKKLDQMLRGMKGETKLRSWSRKTRMTASFLICALTWSCLPRVIHQHVSELFVKPLELQRRKRDASTNCTSSLSGTSVATVI